MITINKTKSFKIEMSERKEHTEHLQQLINQKNNLIEHLEEMELQSKRTKKLILKTQGAIEYLEAIETTDTESEAAPKSESESVFNSEKQKPVRKTFIPVNG